jgi:hypothetical protein
MRQVEYGPEHTRKEIATPALGSDAAARSIHA